MERHMDREKEGETYNADLQTLQVRRETGVRTGVDGEVDTKKEQTRCTR